MGVTELWPVLDPVGEKKPLTYLTGKKVAIDLSVWVMQSKTCKALKNSKNPHLRNLFFRVSHLLTHGITPIFITEGQAPALKENTLRKRKLLQYPTLDINNDAKGCRKNFDRVLAECREMLECLGVPCLKSSGEAEAFCAFLNSKKIVDGCITEDNDSFLYGAETIFRDFSLTDPYVKEYVLKDIETELHLDRRKMVAFALLLGCDYVNGVKGVGKETALKLFQEMKDTDILERFRDWKNLSETELFPSYNVSLDKKRSHCERCGHPGTSTKHKQMGCALCNSNITCYLQRKSDSCPCEWHENLKVKANIKNEIKIYNLVKEKDDFPEQEVIDEYLNYTDIIPSEISLEWSQPDLLSFQEKANNWLGWTLEYSLKNILPVITSWQIIQLCKHGSRETSHFLYQPIRIVKLRRKSFIDVFEVLWKIKDIDNCDSDCNNDFHTFENRKWFSKAYPEVEEEFLSLEKVAKVARKIRSRKKGKKQEPLVEKADIDSSPQPKIMDFFASHASGSCEMGRNPSLDVDGKRDTRKRHIDDDLEDQQVKMQKP